MHLVLGVAHAHGLVDAQALVTMAAAWQQAPLAVLSSISPEPIAAASLGQASTDITAIQ